MPEAREETPISAYNSTSITAYARHALPGRGILRQDRKGFAYLELPARFTTEIPPPHP